MASDVYSSAEVCEKLECTPELLDNLREEGYVHVLGDDEHAMYPRVYVDALAREFARYLGFKFRKAQDFMFLRLFFLQWQYGHAPPELNRSQRDAWRKSIKERIEMFTSNSRVYTMSGLAALLECPLTRVQTWVYQDKIYSIKIGPARYVSRQYARYLKYLLKMPTAQDLAKQLDIPYPTLNRYIQRGEIRARDAPDNTRRFTEDAIAAFVARQACYERSRAELVTPAAAAERLGVGLPLLYAHIKTGRLKSVIRGTVYIPNLEVTRWEKYLGSLNQPFAWLRPFVGQPGERTQLMTSSGVMRELAIPESNLSYWSQQDLLPYFPRTIIGDRGITRDYVKPYIIGLKRFAEGRKINVDLMREYRELCASQGSIV